MADVVLDANVIVGWLDDGDALASRAIALLQRLRAEGSKPVLLDVCVGEAVSVICRRARERKSEAPNLTTVLAVIRVVTERSELRFVAKEAEPLMPMILDIIETTGGTLNFNDALLVALQRVGLIAEVASFDQGLDKALNFRRIS
jgi:predicted nucleic acid-binding protein